MKSLSRGLLAASCALAVAAPAAAAAPITVNVRVEGASSTLFEGPVTTDARVISAPDTSGTVADRPCDVGRNGQFPDDTAPRQGNPTTAVYDAMRASGQAFGATWYGGSLGDLQIDRLGGDVAGPSAGYWSYAVNFNEAAVGGCQFKLSAGSDVLWAINGFGKPFLKLSGPSSVTAGDAVTFSVTNGQTGEGLAGASVGGKTTDGQGRVSLTFNDPGTVKLKAERPDSVRSNAVEVKVGAKGEPAPLPGPPAIVEPVDLIRPLARIRSPRNKATYRARFAPRALRAEVTETGSGIKSVRVRLTRRSGKRCAYYSVARERFVGIRCGRTPAWQEVTRQASFDYLLPSRLGRGRYVFDVTAVDRVNNVDSFRSSGRNRAVFTVR